MLTLNCKRLALGPSGLLGQHAMSGLSSTALWRRFNFAALARYFYRYQFSFSF